MRNDFLGRILAVAAVFAFTRVLLAQTPQQPRTAAAPAAASKPAAPRDLSGYWGNFRTLAQRGAEPGGRRAEEAVLTPWAAEHYQALVEATKRGGQARDLFDPHIVACAPPGAPRVLALSCVN